MEEAESPVREQSAEPSGGRRARDRSSKSLSPPQQRTPQSPRRSSARPKASFLHGERGSPGGPMALAQIMMVVAKDLVQRGVNSGARKEDVPADVGL